MDSSLKKGVLIRSVLLAVALVQVGQITPLSAEIFKCTNKAGKVFYNDKPCPSLDNEKKMRSEKDVVNGYTPSIPVKDKSLLKNGSNVSLVTTLGLVSQMKRNKKSKDKIIPKIPSFKGGNGSMTGRLADAEGKEVVQGLKKRSEEKNYADKEITIEDKRIYLGIKRRVE